MLKNQSLVRRKRCDSSGKECVVRWYAQSNLDKERGRGVDEGKSLERKRAKERKGKVGSVSQG
jgi:hypothetical protein